MNIINDYIFSHIRSDKKNTLFISITITIAAILISTLPLMYYAQHDNMVNMTIDITGNVYFSITQPISADDLHYVSDHPDVAEVFTEAAKEEGMIFVSVLLEDVQKTYPISEEICEILNLQKNVYDRYPISYNRALIGLYGVKDPYTMKQTLLGELLQMVIPMVMLTIVLFIVIIYNVTVTTENRRIKEFGILKSIGMSPKQICGLIIRESLMYCIIAAPVGLVFGYILQAIFLYYKFSVLISVICPLLLIFTVLAASFIPAYKISKLTAIEAIKGNEYAYAKKNIKMKTKTNNLVSKIFGIDGVLASNNFKFYKGMFRTTLISFSLFLTIVFAFQCFMTVWWVDSVELINQQYFDSSIFVYGDMSQNESMTKYLAATDNEYVAYHHQVLSTTVKYTDISEKFIADGGFNTKVLSGIAAVEDGWMMSVHIIGFDNKSFVNYCNEIGANPIDFNDDDVILVDNVEGGFNQNIQDYLPWESSVGDTLTINSSGEYDYSLTNIESCDVTVKYLTDIYPKHTNSNPLPYDIFIIVTEETYYLLFDELNIDSTEDYSLILIKFNENNEPDEELFNALSNYEHSNIQNRADNMQELEDNYERTSSVIMGLLVFFGIVGICSSYSTITGNFNIRCKDFALLRSQGIESVRLKKILYIESVIFSIVPFVITIPITIVANIPMFILFKNTTVKSFLAALPYNVITVCVLACVCSVVLSYIANVRQIFKRNITECIKF